MELKVSDRTLKGILLLGSGLVLGYCAYSGYRIWRKRHLKSIDEGFEDDSRIEEIPKKRVLVLGLENAGKSTLLAQVTSDSGTISDVVRSVKPTEGFNVTTMNFLTLSGVKFSTTIWEIGGRDNVRKYWPNFLQDTDLLIFVVDASDIHNLSLAVREVKWLLADDRLAHVPVLVVANKQDKPTAIPPEEVADALDLGSIHPSKHKIRVIGTKTPPDSHIMDTSIAAIGKGIFEMLGG